MERYQVTDSEYLSLPTVRDKSYPLSFVGHAIAEIGCRHAAHPWVLSICSSLLSGPREETLK